MSRLVYPTGLKSYQLRLLKGPADFYGIDSSKIIFPENVRTGGLYNILILSSCSLNTGFPQDYKFLSIQNLCTGGPQYVVAVPIDVLFEYIKGSFGADEFQKYKITIADEYVPGVQKINGQFIHRLRMDTIDCRLKLNRKHPALVYRKLLRDYFKICRRHSSNVSINSLKSFKRILKTRYLQIFYPSVNIFGQFTGILFFDIDKIPGSFYIYYERLLSEFGDRILAMYRSVSGRGLHILFYEPELIKLNDCFDYRIIPGLNEDGTKFARKNISKHMNEMFEPIYKPIYNILNNFFKLEFGVELDSACANFNRVVCVSFDPCIYYNLNLLYHGK